ncbi:MAG: tail fiber domain-containing protein, partial [Bacteroidota bacterium]
LAAYFVGINNLSDRWAVFDNNASLERLSISSNGNVGIGITSPADKLDVRGTLRLSTSNNHARMYIGTIPGRGTGLVFEIKSAQHGSNRKIIWDGDNNWDSPSDERLKSNISQEKNILERLVQLDVKRYNWKDTYNQKKAEPIIGFIAQEVKPLFPSLVGEVEDEEDKNKKLMTLKYASFGVLAVGAIKELRAEKDVEIAKHKQLIDELKTKVEKLEKQLV